MMPEIFIGCVVCTTVGIVAATLVAAAAFFLKIRHKIFGGKNRDDK